MEAESGDVPVQAPENAQGSQTEVVEAPEINFSRREVALREKPRLNAMNEQMLRKTPKICKNPLTHLHQAICLGNEIRVPKTCLAKPVSETIGNCMVTPCSQDSTRNELLKNCRTLEDTRTIVQNELDAM